MNLTQEEPESHGVAFPKDPVPMSVDMGEHPLHEQIGGSLTEDDVTEIPTSEVTPEKREEVEDLFADLEEEEAGRQAEKGCWRFMPSAARAAHAQEGMSSAL